MNRKKRILMVGEASYTCSGFGTYTYEVMRRLAATGKYELAELSSYGFVNDPRDHVANWIVYANAIREGDSRMGWYNSKHTNQWGEWRMERVCLDFKPDIVWDIRDPWMLEWEKDCAFRKFFHWVIMPTVDSAPQQESWLDTFKSADGVFTYSDWSLDVLRKEGNGKINTKCSAPPGTSLEIFHPISNKAEHKAKMGLSPEMNIIGTVMRNQRRKLYPDILDAFRIFIEKCHEKGLHDLANNTYLFMHTSYPDMGWNLPQILKYSDISHRIIFSYVCRACNKWFASPFQDAMGTCVHCGNVGSAICPTVSKGVDSAFLAQIMQCFDLYIQLSICLTGNQEILTYDGWKPISDVVNGDLVYTHNKTWQYVTQTFKNPNKHNLKKISICSDYETLEITDNHPVYCHTKDTLKSKDKRSVREILGIKIKNHTNIPQPQFVPVEYLKKGDMIVYPIDDTVSWIDHQDILWAKSKRDILDNITGNIQINKGDIYPSKIKIDKEFCRFVGLFASDGGVEPHLIKITSHIDEIINQNLAKIILDRLSYNKSTTRPYPNRKGIDNHLCSVLHSKVFTEWFYTDSLTKKLPHFVFTLPIDLQKEIICGMCMGDGCYSENSVTIYVTTSKQLADDFKVLLRRCRINYNVNTKQKKGNRKLQYRFEIADNIKNNEFVKSEIRSSTSNLYYNNNYLIKIKDIKDMTSNDEYVYNLEVDKDNSYTTRIGNVHNCEGFGMPQVEAASCGVPSIGMPYSATDDILKKTQGLPANIAKRYLELETQAYRMMPDNDSVADMMLKYFTSSTAEKQTYSENARKACETWYNYDNTAKIWENYFDSVELTGCQGKWTETPPEIYDIPQIIPPNLDNSAFMSFLFDDVIRHPELKNSYIGMKILTDINIGASVEGPNITPITREKLFDIFKSRAHNQMMNERARCGMLQLNEEDFINYAHLKAKTLQMKPGDKL